LARINFNPSEIWCSKSDQLDVFAKRLHLQQHLPRVGSGRKAAYS
jgi:hypothetical protein